MRIGANVLLRRPSEVAMFAGAPSADLAAAITEQWMSSSRAVLQRYMDASTARGLDALIEGLTIHMLLSTHPVNRAQIAAYVDRALGQSTHGLGQP